MPISASGSQINVTAVMVDDVSAKLSKLNNSFDSFAANNRRIGEAAVTAARKGQTAWTEFSSAYSVAMSAVRVGTQIWHAATDAFNEYATQVRDVSRNLGTTTEEASRLIQIADDVFISYDKMSTAMKMAQKDGISPTIEGLAQLADEYQRLAPGTERMQFLMDRFGKSGAEMGKLMELGADGIRTAAGEIDKALVLTDGAVRINENYKRSVDELKDAFNGLTFRVMPPLMDALARYLSGWNNMLVTVDAGVDFLMGKMALDEFMDTYMAEAAKMRSTILFGFSEAAETAADGLENLGDAADKLPAKTHRAADALKEFEQALQDMSEANEGALDFALSYVDALDQHADQMKQAYQDVADAQAALDEARATGSPADEVAELVQNLTEAQTKIGELAGEWAASTDRMVFDMARANVAVDGLTDAEAKALNQLAVDMGIMTEQELRDANELIDRARALSDSIQLQAEVKQEQAEIDAKRAELEAAVAAEAEGTMEAVDGTRQAKGGLLDAANETVAVTQNELSTVQNVTAAVNQTNVAQQALNAQIAFGIQIIMGELANQQALTAEIWASVAAQQALNAEINAQPIETRDSGGPGIAGVPYMIGKGAQPELFVPKTDGMFYPRGHYPTAVNGGGGITINITNPKPESSENSIRRQLRKLSYIGIAQ